eukprot:sb/3476163/
MQYTNFQESQVKSFETHFRFCVSQLLFRKGDTFVTDDILDTDDGMWIRGRTESTGESGLIPRVLVQELIPGDEDLYQYEWFYGRAPESTVLEILKHDKCYSSHLNHRDVFPGGGASFEA